MGGGSGNHRLIAFVADRYFDNDFHETGRKNWLEGSKAFTKKYFEGQDFVVDIKSLSLNSEMTADFAKLLSVYSIGGLEKIRLSLKDMRARSKVRASVLDKVFG